MGLTLGGNNSSFKNIRYLSEPSPRWTKAYSGFRAVNASLRLRMIQADYLWP